MKGAGYIRLKNYLSKPKNSTEAGLLFCMLSGIWLGELSGLMWQDIDLNRGTIQIKRTVSRIKRRYVVVFLISTDIAAIYATEKSIANLIPKFPTDSAKNIPPPAV